MFQNSSFEQLDGMARVGVYFSSVEVATQINGLTTPTSAPQGIIVLLYSY